MYTIEKSKDIDMAYEKHQTKDRKDVAAKCHMVPEASISIQIGA